MTLVYLLWMRELESNQMLPGYEPDVEAVSLSREIRMIAQGACRQLPNAGIRPLRAKMESKLLTGKVLRKLHRTEMLSVGGLVRNEDKGRTEQTQKYIPLIQWLKSPGNKQLGVSVEAWQQRKKEQRRIRRIKKGSNPVGPSKLATIRRLLKEVTEKKESEQKERLRLEAAS